jgi:acetoin utilization deacetylase AcuC-like enzyme
MAVRINRHLSKCDILFYQAGADPHIQDPGGGWMRDDELERRDDLVFMLAQRQKVPVVWNLAGGYQQPVEKVLVIHDNTKEAALAYEDR